MLFTGPVWKQCVYPYRRFRYDYFMYCFNFCVRECLSGRPLQCVFFTFENNDQYKLAQPFCNFCLYKLFESLHILGTNIIPPPRPSPHHMTPYPNRMVIVSRLAFSEMCMKLIVALRRTVWNLRSREFLSLPLFQFQKLVADIRFSHSFFVLNSTQ